MLRPVWRCQPNHGSGVFTIALDPAEAAFVLERGWATLDDIRYRVSLYGCDGEVEGDGRVTVRCEIDDARAELALNEEAETLRRFTYRDRADRPHVKHEPVRVAGPR